MNPNLTRIILSALALAVAVGTTIFQAYRAASRNPVEALRYE